MRITSLAGLSATFALPPEISAKLEIYDRLLLQWQKAVNLVAPQTLPDRWMRHYADSAQLLSHGPNAKTWVDIGSGGGFPGLVIAICLANQKECVVHLIESNARKCAFLSEVIRQTGVSARVHNARIAELVQTRVSPVAEIVSARALAPLDALLELALPFFGDASAGLFLKGREAASEIADARANWSFDSQAFPSLSDPSGQILKIEKPRRFAGP